MGFELNNFNFEIHIS